MKKITKKDFIQLYNEYKENGYWNKEWGLTNKEETELADAFKTVYSAEPSGDYNEEEFFDEQFSLYNKGELSTFTVIPKTINDISAADFERLMWEYEASGDKAFVSKSLIEEIKCFFEANGIYDIIPDFDAKKFDYSEKCSNRKFQKFCDYFREYIEYWIHSEIESPSLKNYKK